MSGAEVLDVGREAIWLTIQLAAPCLIVGLLVGVGIGLLQALTQIQEATLVAAPKIVAIFVSLIFWIWLWGIPGALLSVPILVSIITGLGRVGTGGSQQMLQKM